MVGIWSVVLTTVGLLRIFGWRGLCGREMAAAVAARDQTQPAKKYVVFEHLLQENHTRNHDFQEWKDRSEAVL